MPLRKIAGILLQYYWNEFNQDEEKLISDFLMAVETQPRISLPISGKEFCANRKFRPEKLHLPQWKSDSSQILGKHDGLEENRVANTTNLPKREEEEANHTFRILFPLVRLLAKNE